VSGPHSKKLSRREFLRVGAVAAGTGLAVTCVPEASARGAAAHGAAAQEASRMAVAAAPFRR